MFARWQQHSRREFVLSKHWFSIILLLYWSLFDKLFMRPLLSDTVSVAVCVVSASACCLSAVACAVDNARSVASHVAYRLSRCIADYRYFFPMLISIRGRQVGPMFLLQLSSHLIGRWLAQLSSVCLLEMCGNSFQYSRSRLFPLGHTHSHSRNLCIVRHIPIPV